MQDLRRLKGRSHDRYGRIFAYIHPDDRTFVNAEIIRRGYASAFTRYPFRYLEAFRAFSVGEAAAAGVIVVAATIIIATFALRVVSSLFAEEAG